MSKPTGPPTSANNALHNYLHKLHMEQGLLVRTPSASTASGSLEINSPPKKEGDAQGHVHHFHRDGHHKPHDEGNIDFGTGEHKSLSAFNTTVLADLEGATPPLRQEQSPANLPNSQIRRTLARSAMANKRSILKVRDTLRAQAAAMEDQLNESMAPLDEELPPLAVDEALAPGGDVAELGKKSKHKKKDSSSEDDSSSSDDDSEDDLKNRKKMSKNMKRQMKKMGKLGMYQGMGGMMGGGGGAFSPYDMMLMQYQQAQYYNYYYQQQHAYQSANCNQNVTCDQLKMSPMKSAAFVPANVDICEARPVCCTNNGEVEESSSGEEDELEDGVAFSYKPRPNGRTEMTVTVEPKKQPWLSMMRCGFRPVVNCTAPPCYLSPNNCPGLHVQQTGPSQLVNNAYYPGPPSLPTLDDIRKSTNYKGETSSSEHEDSENEDIPKSKRKTTSARRRHRQPQVGQVTKIEEVPETSRKVNQSFRSSVPQIVKQVLEEKEDSLPPLSSGTISDGI